VALYQFPDGILGCIGGVLRGMGRQTYLMAFNLIGFWGFGVVLGYTMAFVFDYGLVGLWCGILTGVVVTAVLCVITMLRVDWDKEALKAKERLQVIEQLDAAGDLPEVAYTLGASATVLTDRQKRGVREYARQRSIISTAMPVERSASFNRTNSISASYTDNNSVSQVLTGSTYGSMRLRDPMSAAFAGRG